MVAIARFGPVEFTASIAELKATYDSKPLLSLGQTHEDWCDILHWLNSLNINIKNLQEYVEREVRLTKPPKPYVVAKQALQAWNDGQVELYIALRNKAVALPDYATSKAGQRDIALLDMNINIDRLEHHTFKPLYQAIMTMHPLPAVVAFMITSIEYILNGGKFEEATEPVVKAIALQDNECLHLLERTLRGCHQWELALTAFADHDIHHANEFCILALKWLPKNKELLQLQQQIVTELRAAPITPGEAKATMVHPQVSTPNPTATALLVLPNPPAGQ